MQSNPVSQDHRCESQIPIEAQAKGRGAKTYGQTMEPLDIETFLASLPAPLDSHPLVRHLVEMVDVTTRAEKISDPANWSEEEQHAWNAGDYDRFSRLRGYTETEIEQFNGYLKAAANVDQTLGEDTAIFVVYRYNIATQPYDNTAIENA